MLRPIEFKSVKPKYIKFLAEEMLYSCVIQLLFESNTHILDDLGVILRIQQYYQANR